MKLEQRLQHVIFTKEGVRETKIGGYIDSDDIKVNLEELALHLDEYTPLQMLLLFSRWVENEM